jgi:hypothetical protein
LAFFGHTPKAGKRTKIPKETLFARF